VPTVSGRTMGTAIALALAVWLGALAVAFPEPLAEAIRWALDLFDAGDLVAWCIGLLCVAVVLRLASRATVVSIFLDRAKEPLRRAGAVRAGIALPFVVAAAFALRVALDRTATLPRVFGDELVYSGIAKSLAAGDGLELRGSPVGLGYGPVYPLVLSPIYRFAADGASAFWGVQTLNALLMASTAVPAYYLARRVVSNGWSLVVAALSVAVPAMAYTPLVMTEALFYPGFVTVCLLMVLTLERPSHARQALFVASIAALAAVRVQALVFVPALLTAVLVDSLRSRTGIRRTVRSFGTSLTLIAVGAVVAVAAYGGDIRGPLGAYGVLVRGYSVGDTAEWLIRNVAVLEVSLGFVAFGAFLVAAVSMLRRPATGGERTFATAAVTITGWTAISVALLSASPYGLDRLHWRSIFMIVPVVLTGFAWWLASGRPRPLITTAAAAVATLVLPVFVPWRQVVELQSVDSPSTIVWAALADLWSAPEWSAVILPFAALGAAALWLARSAAVMIASVLLAFAAVWAATDFDAAMPREAVERFAWVDRALPDGERALLLHVNVPEDDCPWISSGSRQRDLEVMTEFFNTSVTSVMNVWGQIVHDGLLSREITFGSDGSLRDGGEVVPTRYLVTDSRLIFAGTPLARLDLRTVGVPWQPRPTGSLTLWEVREPARLTDPLQIRKDYLSRLSCLPPDSVSQ
jgi:hypothetical protein